MLARSDFSDGPACETNLVWLEGWPHFKGGYMVDR